MTFRNRLTTSATLAEGAVESRHIATNLQSDNYDGGGQGDPGTQGWYIGRDTGYAEFQDALFRGIIEVGTDPDLRINNLGLRLLGGVDEESREIRWLSDMADPTSVLTRIANPLTTIGDISPGLYVESQDSITLHPDANVNIGRIANPRKLRVFNDLEVSGTALVSDHIIGPARVQSANFREHLILDRSGSATGPDEVELTLSTNTGLGGDGLRIYQDGVHIATIGDAGLHIIGDALIDGDATVSGAINGNPLAYAQVTSSQTGIDSEAGLTGLFVSVDVAANRRIRITGHTSWWRDTADADARVRLEIRRDGTQIQRDHSLSGLTTGATVAATLITQVVEIPGAGSYNYHLVARRVLGSGALGMRATSDEPAFILVEDIGPA